MPTTPTVLAPDSRRISSNCIETKGGGYTSAMPTTSIVAWAIAALLGFLAILGVARSLFRDRSRGRRRCSKCWYDMSGTSGLTCPECGRTARTEQHLFRTRRRWWRAVAFLLLLIPACALPIAEQARRLGWAGLPNTVLIAAAPVVYSKPRATTFDGSYQVELFKRLKQPMSRINTRLLDRVLAGCIRHSTDQPQAIVDAQTLQDNGIAVPHCLAAMRHVVADADALSAARLMAIQSLSMMTMGEPEMLPFWQSVLHNPDFGGQVHVTAVACIGNMESAGGPAIDDVMQALNSSDTVLVQQAAVSVGRLRRAGLPALPRLMELLSSSDDMTATRAAWGLSYFGADAAPAVPILIQYSIDESRPTRRRFIETFGYIGPAAEPATDYLLECLKSPNQAVRAESLLALAHILGPIASHPSRGEVIAKMLDHLDDPHVLVRMEVLQALFLVGWNPAERGQEMRRRGDTLQYRSIVWGKLLEARAAGTLPAMEDELIDLLRPGVREDKSEEQEAAMEALGYLRCKKAIDVLHTFCANVRQCIESADSQLRYIEARRAIHRIRTGVRIR